MPEELRALAGFVCNFKLEDADERTIDKARRCILDSLGSALGAAKSEEVRNIGKTYREWCGTGDNGKTADAWVQGCRPGFFSALMVNGVMSHELEMDDVHTHSKSHIGAVVIPAAWTLADAIGADGRQFLESVIVGYEVMARVGLGMDVSSNRKKGWHATGILGTFGAAAAAARLLKLNEEQTASALGLAGTQSSGLWAFLAEGATCKKLHPARSIVNGVSACLLSMSGMTGPVHILDAEDGGLYKAVSDSYDMSKLTTGLGESFEINNMDKKPYPCCRTTHHAIDTALALRDELDVDEIKSVLVETYDVGVLQCGFTKYPETWVEAKFSIPFTCAAAFVNGRVTISEFSKDVISDPRVERIAKATTVVADDLFTERYPKRWGSRMTVTMNDGTKLVKQIDDMSGSLAVPLSAKQEADKFIGLTAPVMGEERANKIMEAVLRIEELDRLPNLA